MALVASDGGGLDTLLNCMICMEPYQEPKVLPCQHTFCKQCLHTMHEMNRDPRYTYTPRINCPTCRTKVILPRNGVEGLPGDFKINQIQELIDKIDLTKKPTSSNECDVCVFEEQSVMAEHYCVQCTKHLCSHCQSTHAQNPLFKDHSTICMDIASVSTLECKEHQEELKYYCSKCSEILCTVCVIGKHGDHQINDLSLATQRQQDQVQEKLDVLKGKLDEFEEKTEQLERLKGAKERIYLTTQEAVKTHALSLIEIIKVNEKKLLDELENSHKNSMEQIAREAENTDVTAGNIASLYDFASDMTDCSQSLQLMAMFTNLYSRLTQMSEIQCEALSSELKFAHKFKSQDNLNVGVLNSLKLKRDRVNTSLGESRKGGGRDLLLRIDVDQTDNYAHLRRSTSRSSQLASPRQYVDMYSFHGLDNAFESDTKIDDSELFTCCTNNMNLLWKKHDLNSVRDVTFLRDKSLIVTEYQSRSEHIKLYDCNGNLLSKTIRGRLDWMRPWGVVAGEDTTATFHITDQRNYNIRSLDRQLLVTRNIRTNLQKPTGIAMSRRQEFIVTDTSGSQQNVSLIDQNGHTIRQWGKPGTADTEFNNPEFITTDSRGRVIVSDNLNHCVKVFDPDGFFLFKFNELGISGTTMCNPEGVTTDVNDNILVANGGNVSLFSSDGEFICHFEMPSNRHRRLSFLSDDRSYGISVHPSGLLAVTAHSSLYVYSIPMIGYQ